MYLKTNYTMRFNIFLIMAIVVIFNLNSFAQTTKTSTVTTSEGVKITTNVTQQPTLSDQVAYLEKMLDEAKNNPEMHKNGTVEKYKLALEDRRKKLNVELEEKNKIESQKK